MAINPIDKIIDDYFNDKMDNKPLKQKERMEQKLKHPFFYCWVTGVDRIPDVLHAAPPMYYKFNFQFYLWQKNDNGDMVNQSFQSNYNAIKSIYEKACDAKIYFAEQKFPRIYKKRKPSLKNDLSLLEDYMVFTNIKCQGPSSSWKPKRFKSQSTHQHMEELSYILCKLFNSPTWVIQNDLYTLFNISNDKNQSFNSTNNISTSIGNHAQLLLDKLKYGTCPDIAVGLSWDEMSSVILSDDAFNEEEKLIQQDYEAKQCRLNNPCSCWKPLMDKKQIRNGDYPWLQINLRSKTTIKKLRIQPSSDLCFYIKKFDLHYGSRANNVLDHLIQDIAVTKSKWTDNRDYEEIILPRTIYAKYIRIVPKSWHNSIGLRLEIYGEVNWNHKQLLNNDLLRKMEFSELSVVTKLTRPLGIVSFTNHWGLKFEGDDYLLTLEWYNNNKILVSIEENTCVGQRIFWYSSFTDRKKDFKYTQRWGTLFQLEISESDIKTDIITGKCIGLLIDRWYSNSKYKIYNDTTNNCQHFVRDILSLFSKQAAKYLVDEMEHVKVDKRIHPLFETCDQMDEESRMNSIRSILQREYKLYNINQIRCTQLQQAIIALKNQLKQQQDVQNKFSIKSLKVFLVNKNIDFKEIYNFMDFLSDLEMDSDAIVYDLDGVDDQQSTIYVNKNKQYKHIKDYVVSLTNKINKINPINNEVKLWLSSNGLSQYFSLFIQNGFNSMEMIKEINNKSDLDYIGIKIKAHQIKIMNKINLLNGKKN